MSICAFNDDLDDINGADDPENVAAALDVAKEVGKSSI